MSVEQNKLIVQRWHEEVFNGRNLSAVDEILHPDYVNHNQNLRGLAAAKEWLTRLACDDPPPGGQIIVEDTITEGDKVVTRWTIQEGGRVRSAGISIHRIVEGKIIEDWARGNSSAWS
jgi:predicted SnoaL-like aldol condensation-catalyzing enzyme